jgi:hypothetical protein
VATQQERFDAARQYQAYYDQTLRNIGARAQQPILGNAATTTEEKPGRAGFKELHALEGLRLRHDLGFGPRQCKCATGRWRRGKAMAHFQCGLSGSAARPRPTEPEAFLPSLPLALTFRAA